METLRGLCALRGNVIFAPSRGELTAMRGGCVITSDGIVRSVSPVLPDGWGGEIVDFGDALITPSFSDLHLHAPQFPMLGLGMDLQLIDWLGSYTFPVESRFKDTAYARGHYSRLAHELVRRGTTRVSMFSSIHREATHVLIEELERVGVTGYVGKVNMDRNGPPELTEDTEESARETIRFIDECAKYEHIAPAITPRFTPSCSDDLMAGLGKIATEHPGIAIQSHMSENVLEVAWVKELCPSCEQYWQTYERCSLFGSHTVLAHCVHSDERERAAMRDAGVWAAHCPDSNTNLQSGIAPVRRMLDEGVHVGLGSDIAGGAKLSMNDVATEAIRVSKLRWLATDKAEAFLTVREAFWLATSAGQGFFGAAPGFGAGEPLHAIVWYDAELGDTSELTLEERMERTLYLGGPSTIRAVYSAGRRIDI